jgi:ATP-dependent Clp protease ATP-binding subunit ClpC
MTRERTSRGTLDPKIPSKELAEAMETAGKRMLTTSKEVMTPELLLLTLLETDRSAARHLLTGLLENRGREWDLFRREIEAASKERTAVDVKFDWVSDSNRRVPLSDDLLVVMDEALSMARAQDEVYVGPEHILFGMLHRSVALSRIFDRYGITMKALQDVLQQRATAKSATTTDYVALARQGETVPVYFRSSLLRDLTNLLILTSHRHVVLAGADGVGKRTLVYSLAQLIAEGKGPQNIASVIQIHEEALLDNPTAAVRAGLRRAKGGVLCIPHLGRFFGGYRADMPEAASKELMKAFYDNEVTIIGTANEADYAALLQPEAIISSHAHVLRVPPTTSAETLAVLEVLKPSIEGDYDLRVDMECLDEVARLSGRYLTAVPLPASAVHLLHRTCATVKMSSQAHIPGAADARDDETVDVEDVLLTVSQLTAIPISKLGVEERTKYAHMVEYLRQRIIGQDEAVLAVSRAVKTARVGLKDPKRPIGSFFFLGPTGVGKTELAKALSEFLFGTEDTLVVLDMTEYQDENAINRMIGAPPGYIGYEEGGQLTERIATMPYCVVLFDEVEKAHYKVLDVLLQIMEEGRLTDGKGRTVSFSEAVVILTSNIGGQYLVNKDVTEPAARELAEEELHQHFRPEFLNRLTEIIFFNRLTPSDLRRILDLLLKKEIALAASQGLHLQVSDDARDWLVQQNDHPEWGARPLRRILEKHIREPLADWLLHQASPQDASVQVTLRDGQLQFSAQAPKRPA